MEGYFMNHNFKLLLMAVTAVLLFTGISLAEPIQYSLLTPRPDVAPANLLPAYNLADDEILSYDNGIVSYLSNYSAQGTKFAVRFTNTHFPQEACSLKALAIATTLGGGNGLLHIWADNDGVPGADLITPLSISLNGNGQFQVIQINPPIWIEGTDFHAGWELSQNAPPYATTDDDGVTENRSQVKTSSGEWTVLLNDLNIRALISYGPYQGGEQDLVYSENFDAGMGAWSGDWGLASTRFHTPPNSMADSPVGNYPDNANLEVQMTQDVDLTSYLGGYVEFWTRFLLESGFDYVYFDISADSGNSWNNLEIFNGEASGDSTWHVFTEDIGGYAGMSVRFRFTLISDGAYNVDGMYVDDFSVYGSTIDNSPPLILHTGPTDSTSIPAEYIVLATISDPSGIESASLTYTIDAGGAVEVGPDSINGNSYYFPLPGDENDTAGEYYSYYLTATDNASNTGTSVDYSYVRGTIIYYDDGSPDFIYQYAAGNASATRITPVGGRQLLNAMVKLYTDVSHDLDTIDFKIWNKVGNNPGDVIYGPQAVWPQSTLDDPEAWTYIDLRHRDIYISSDVFIGLTYRSALPVILGDATNWGSRSMAYQGGAWGDAGAGYHIRAIVGPIEDDIDYDNGNLPVSLGLYQNYPNPFNAQTRIYYSLPGPADVKLEVFNLMGQRVATLVEGKQSPGYHDVAWDASDVASGIYFYKLDAGGKTFIKKMALVK